jgi:outer membrane protein assembly factor BamB
MTPSKALAASPPVTADGVVYVGYAIADATHNPRLDTYVLAALRARDGLPLWRIPTTGFTVPIVAAAGVLIVPDGDTGKMVGLRASDGATLWHSSLSAGVGSDYGEAIWNIVPSGGVLYGIENGNVDGAVFALRLTDGRTLWQTHLQRGPLGPRLVVDATSVYVAAGDGSVVALQADTGAVRWTAYTGSLASLDVFNEPIATYDGQLYVRATDTGGVSPAVLGLDAANGTSDGVALRLPLYTEVLYPAMTADIFTTLVYPSVPPGGTSAPAPTINGYRLSATSAGQLLWSVPVHFDGEILPTAHDAQTFYVEFEAAPAWVISAYRLTDGAVRWRRQALALDTPLVAGSGELFETTSGIDDVCRTPLVHQAPRVRALAAASGSVVWTRALDATR